MNNFVCKFLISIMNKNKYTTCKTNLMNINKMNINKMNINNSCMICKVKDKKKMNNFKNRIDYNNEHN